MERYKLGIYEKALPAHLSLSEKLIEAKAAGFDYLELSIDESEQRIARLGWGDAEICSLLEAEAKTGVPIKSICLSAHRRFPLGHQDPAVRERGLAIMCGAVRVASRLGIRIIQIAGYDVYYETSSEATRSTFALGLAKSVEMAAAEGVVLSFETMETDFINTVAKARRWVDRIESPYLQIYPDIGNITNAALSAGSDVLEDLNEGRGHIVALHMKEVRPGLFREIPYGEGQVDFVGAAAAALSLGVRLFVGEFWHKGEANWREIARKNREYLAKALAMGSARAGLSSIIPGSVRLGC